MKYNKFGDRLISYESKPLNILGFIGTYEEEVTYKAYERTTIDILLVKDNITIAANWNRNYYWAADASIGVYINDNFIKSFHLGYHPTRAYKVRPGCFFKYSIAHSSTPFLKEIERFIKDELSKTCTL